VLIGTVAGNLIVRYIFGAQSYSRTVFVIDAILLAVLLTVSRASFNLIAEVLHRNVRGHRVVIYGAGDGGSWW
jgi:FlaA1/EpsC-like NDP-sugar epimerase